MKNCIVVICLIFSFLSFAQERQLLKGKAISDETVVDLLDVKNITSGDTTTGDEKGDFKIMAKEGDVLEFSSPVFTTLKHTLKAIDFNDEIFVIRLIPSAIIIDEVELSGLTGDLLIDSKNTKVVLLNEKFKDEFDSAMLNLGRVVDNPSMNFNFIAVFGMLKDMMSSDGDKSSKNKQQFSTVEHKSFSKVLQESYPESFFTEVIKVPREKLGLFLNFCNDGAKRYLLDPKNEADLIAYLKERYIVYSYQSQ